MELVMRYLVGLAAFLCAANAFAQAAPEKAPPLAVRLEIYRKLAYMTDRDFASLSPQEQQQVTCDQLAEKIDIELDAERNGSHGFYNLDALRRAGPDYCRAYLMSIQ
jgi:hypothetical protein